MGKGCGCGGVEKGRGEERLSTQGKDRRNDTKEVLAREVSYKCESDE